MTPSTFAYVAAIFCMGMALGNLRELYKAEPLYSDQDYLEQIESRVLAVGAWVVFGAVVAFVGIWV